MDAVTRTVEGRRMNDRKVIYLDDALDALRNEFKKAPTTAIRAMEVLRALPSAQPEAKPPKWVAEDRFVKNSFAEYPHCPQCNAEVTTGQCYCMICGQHIDWSEDDG